MSDLGILIKYNLINKFKLNKLKQNRFKNLSLGLACFILLIFIEAFCLGYMCLMAHSFKQIATQDVNITSLIILMSLSTSSLMILVLLIPSVETTLFKSKDYDLLKSMPIKNSTIILSKLIVLLILVYLINGLLVLNSIIAFMIFDIFSLKVLLYGLICLIVSPIIPFSLSIILSLLVTKISIDSKYKTIISTVLSIALVLVIVFMMLFVAKVEGSSPSEIYDSYVMVFSRLSYPSYLLFEGMFNKPINILIIALISIVLFIVAIYLVSISFNEVTNKINLKTMSNKKTKDQKQKTPQTRLILLELKKYFSLSGYVLNTIMSPIISTVFLIFFIINFNEVKAYFTEIDKYSNYVVLIILILFNSISPTTSSSISLEKRTLWILKSLPVKEIKIFNSKIAISLLITVPFTIINSLIASIYFKVGVLEAIGLTLIPVFIEVVCAIWGLIINLKYPSFTWDNEIEAVKQAKSVLFSMVFGLVISIITICLCVIFKEVFLISYAFSYLIVCFILLIVIIYSYHILKTYGTKLFRSL